MDCKIKKKQLITTRTISGEAAEVNLVIVNDKLSNKWKDIQKEVSDEEIFNANVTEIFYSFTSYKTLNFKKKKFVGGKMSKKTFNNIIIVCQIKGRKTWIPTYYESKKTRWCFKNKVLSISIMTRIKTMNDISNFQKLFGFIRFSNEM